MPFVVVEHAQDRREHGLPRVQVGVGGHHPHGDFVGCPRRASEQGEHPVAQALRRAQGEVHLIFDARHRPPVPGEKQPRGERASSLEKYWEDAIHSCKGAPNVIDIRNFGLMGAIEFAPKPGAPGSRGYNALVKCFEAGVLIRYTADTLAFSPPLIVEKPQIERIFDAVRKVLQTLE